MAGGAGGGGEYDVQLGFGWTNGAVLDLLSQYGATAQPRDDTSDASQSPIAIHQLALSVSLLVLLIR